MESTIKSFTDITQSKKLVNILPIESADNAIVSIGYNDGVKTVTMPKETLDIIKTPFSDIRKTMPCWSLASLLNILHSKVKDIPSLSGGGYKDSKYISDWCLDYEFENGDYQKTFANNPVDACVAMIEKLHELNILKYK